MAHVVKTLPWGTIDIVLRENRIFFQQTWQYNWVVQTPLAPWSLAEKRRFHRNVDLSIWGNWSNRFRFPVSGNHEFARRNHSAGVPINFDVRWVTATGQWTCEAWKIHPGTSRTSNVTFGTRRIELDDHDFTAHRACNNATPQVCRNGFQTVPHEFGHTFDLDDEYTTGSPHLADSTSIMNVGREFRRRHFALMLTELNTMIPGVTFAAPAGLT